jgi:hypothetical protein
VVEAETEDAKPKIAGFMIDVQDCRDAWARKCLYSGFMIRTSEAE